MSKPSGAGRTAARHGVLYLVGTAVQGIALLLATPFVTGALGDAEYGAVAVGLAVMTTLVNALTAGFPQLILRDYGHGDDGRHGAHVSVGLMTTGGISIAVAGIAVVEVLAVAGLVDDPTLPRAIVLGVGAILCTGAVQAVLRAAGRPVPFVLMALGTSLLPMLAGLVAVQWSADAGTYLTAYNATLAAFAVLATVLSRPVWPWRDGARARASLPPALNLLPQGLAISALLSGDTMIAGAFLGPAAAGTYQPALALGNLVFTVAMALFNAWGPAVYRQHADRRWRWTGESAVLLAALMAFGAVCLTLVARWVVPVFVQGDFDLGTIEVLVGILAWTAVPQIAYMGCTLLLVERGRTGALALITVGAAVVFLGVAVLTSQGMGLRALAVTRIAAHCGLFVVAYLVARGLDPSFRLAGWAAGLVVAALASGTLTSALGTPTVQTVVYLAMVPLLGLAMLAQRRRLAVASPAMPASASGPASD